MSLLYSKKFIVATILFLILVFGAFLRFYSLGGQSYWMDEGYTINAVLATIQNGTENFSARLDSGQPYSCPLYCSPAAAIAKTFGETAFSYRLLSAICGIIFILVIYLFAKILFKRESIALLSAFFVSFSYWQIAWSRQARWYTELELFFWLALLFFYVSFPRRREPSSKRISLKQVSCFAFSIIFTILSIITHKVAYLLPVVILGWYIIPILRGVAHQRRGVLFGKVILSMLCATAIIAFAEYGLGLHFIANAIGNIEFHYNLPYYLSFYLRNYWPFIILAVYGYFSAEKEQKTKIVLLALPFLAYLFFLSFFTQIVHYRYLFHATPALYLIAAAVIVRAIPSTPVIPAQAGIRFKGVRRWIPACAIITIVIAIFFLSGQGILFPKKFYTLEADDPSKMNRPYYAYTPQPDFNAAYAAVKQNIQSDEIIISSHPHFNKIFLDQPGYWIKYDYLGMENTPSQIANNKEYYAGAEVINNLDELKKITAQKHGYLIFDYMSADGRIDPQMINYIQTNFSLFFHNKINSYSQIWVYYF